MSVEVFSDPVFWFLLGLFGTLGFLLTLHWKG
jgi:hypothetical protein